MLDVSIFVGWDPREADIVVGTSAGSICFAACRPKRSDD